MTTIVPIQPIYSEAFRDLNYAWIEQLFEIEESDRILLSDPQTHIIDKGGDVFIALLDNEPIGTCALINKEQDGLYELAKMAVDEKARGKKIGWKLGVAVVERARARGAERIILETNSALKPAIGLYEKLGFKEVVKECVEYQRCDIQMILDL